MGSHNSESVPPPNSMSGIYIYRYKDKDDPTIMGDIGLYRGYMGIMEKKMESTVTGYIGIYKQASAPIVAYALPVHALGRILVIRNSLSML